MLESSSDEDEQAIYRVRVRRERAFRLRINFPRYISTFREEFRVDAEVKS